MAADGFGSRYALLRPLGSGGMGEVFLVRDLAAGRMCALKRLKPAARARRTALRREFETLTRLRHPAIVAVFDFGLAPDGTPFYTMEYVRGRSPDLLLRPGDWHGLLGVGAEIAHGLEVLHAQGVIHGDLKPSNVIAVPDDHHDGSIASIRLVDFGLAAALGDAAAAHRGTSGFAAPEVVHGDPPSVASDLYALGATLFTLACGRPPFRGESAEAILRRQLSGSPDRVLLEERGAPAALNELVLQLLASDPRERPRAARDVRRELESIDPSTRRSLDERLGSASLVGRERELSAVERHLARKLRRSHMVVVVGPDGIGKSAFLAEVAARAALAGHPVIRLSGPTLAPVADILQGLADPPQEGSDAALECLLDRRVESMTAGEPGHHPVYLVDDAHSLDALSRKLVRRVLLHPDAGPTVWVLARDAAVPSPDDERTLGDAGLVEILTLGPLEMEGMTQLVAAHLRELAPRRLNEFLWRTGRGNPGLTIDALQTAARSGALRESDAGLVVDGEALDKITVAQTPEAARRARVEVLPPEARRVLHVLAVMQAGTAAQLSRIDGAIDEAALSQVRELGLVREGPGGRFELASSIDLEGFDPKETQQLHRDALSLEGLLPGERFRHLRGAGDVRGALEEAEAALETVADSVLLGEAAKLAESVDPTLAARWHERTAREHFKHSEYKRAIPHLERSLRLDPAREPSLERLHLLSSACLRLGDADRTGEVVAEALRRDPPLALRSRFLTNESSRLHTLGYLDRAVEAARHALEAAHQAADPEAEGMAAQSLVYYHLARGQVPEAAGMADLAAKACGNGGTAFRRARAEAARAAVAQAQQQPELALERYQSALELARGQGIRGVAEEVLISRSIVLGELGRWSEFREANAEALRLALEDHRPRNAAVAMANLAHADALMGQPRRARREARSAIRLARRHLPLLEASGWRAFAHAERASGRLEAAERAGRRALELATERASADEIGWCRLEYGRVCAARNRWTEALPVWLSGIEDLPPGSAVLACHLTASAGEAALQMGKAQEAAAALQRVEQLTGRSPVSPHARAFALRLRAQLAISEGVLEEGMRIGAEALAAFRLVPAPADYASTALALAHLVLERPDAHMAPLREWLEEAAAACERLGNYRGRERALQSLVQWYRRRGERPVGGRSDRALFEAVSELLTSLSDLKELAERAMGLVVEQLSAERGVFLVIDPESGELTPVAERGALDSAARDQAVGFSRRVVTRVAESGGSLLISDAPLDPRARSDSVVRLGLRSILCTPLSAGGRVVGAVYLDDSRRPRAFDESDQDLLEGIGHLLAVAVDRSLGQLEIERTNELLIGENRSLRREVATRFRTQELVGTSLALQRILPLIERASATNTTVLLVGESGTGKELIARIIHSNSKRRLRPFVGVNCGAITDTLVESELFGILPNVATGVRGRDGLFRQADGGTLFLDELGDMPLRQQVALFAAISNREISPVGGGRPIPIDVRIIAATNRDLRQMVEERTFREELYYRLHVFPIEVPPLRDRKADIPALAKHFVTQLAALQEREVPEMSNEFMAALMRSRWPGNVREFQNYIERLMAVTPGRVLSPRPLPRDLEERPARRTGSLADQVEVLERKLVREALERCGGNQTRAARELGIAEPGVRRRMRKFGLLGDRQKRRIDSKRRMRT